MNETTIQRLAAFPMYDFPHLAEAHNLLWSKIAERLSAAAINGVPDALVRPENLHDFWRDPQLLLTQTCGYPLVTALNEVVQLVATPVYKAKGCNGIFHRGCITVHIDNHIDHLSALQGKRAAVNSFDSNSGMNLFRAAIAPVARNRSFFQEVIVTGSHLDSLNAIVNGRADVACIDCISFAHIKTFKPDLANHVQILHWTDETPGLPLITGLSTDTATLSALRSALKHVISDSSNSIFLDQLLLEDIEVGSLDSYKKLLLLQQQAIDFGYPELQ